MTHLSRSHCFFGMTDTASKQQEGMAAWKDRAIEMAMWLGSYVYQTEQPPQPPVPPAAKDEIRVKEATIKLATGDITEAKADVLVNSTGERLNLSDGILASALLKKAGNKLQRECKRLAPLHVNNVVESKGYDLNCQKVYHCRCPQNYTPKSLKTIITKCLTMANKGGFSSMVIPSLGTGRLGYPHEDVVASVVNAITCFLTSLSENKQKTSLKLVTLMVHETDKKSVQAFTDYFDDHYTTSEALALIYEEMEQREQTLDTEQEETTDTTEQITSAKTELTFPTNWELPFDVYNEVDLLEGTEEWAEVEQDFTSTLKAQARILEIVRVQNPMTHRLYSTLKEYVDKQLEGKGFNVERKLWHGTREDNVKKIARTNFDRRFAGEHGTQYGYGCYFSTTSQYSHSYSSRSSHAYSSRSVYGKTYHMIRAKVVTGEYCQGSSDMKTAPTKYKSTEQYNSVVDKEPNPTIFVTFQDASACPEYIIKYQLIN